MPPANLLEVVEKLPENIYAILQKPLGRSLEEGNKIGGWGGEVISQICESSCKLPKTICRIGAEDTPIPASLLLEENVLPSEKIIIKTIKDIFKE